MNRRGFLGALAAFISAPAVALVPIAGPRVVEWADAEMAFREYYSEVYEDVAYRDHALMGLIRKKGI